MLNNADLGMTLQKYICDFYKLQCNDFANAQFSSNYNENYIPFVKKVVPKIFRKLNRIPVVCLTFSQSSNSRESRSPDNFLLASSSGDAETLSIRTNKSGDKIAPRVVGQCGVDTFNEFFSEITNVAVHDKSEIKKVVYNHIHRMMPIFLDYLFTSDYTVWLQNLETESFFIFDRKLFVNIECDRNKFTFTRDLNSWNESTTLKYDGISIAEIQIHKNRTFKFRFLMKALMTFIEKEQKTTETLGMTAEKTICDMFNLKYPPHFEDRVSRDLQKKLTPIINSAFNSLPKAIRHTGSEQGERGGQSKCSYDFVLDGNLTLSLKTNTGKMVCPPEVGQPGALTCGRYFGHLINGQEINPIIFKQMVFNCVDKMLPIYIEHLTDSDYLLWIFKKQDAYDFRIVLKNTGRNFVWEKSKLTFTKNSLDEWNESNTLKYDNISIGEFQIHRSRNSYKFRFNLENLLNVLEKNVKQVWRFLTFSL